MSSGEAKARANTEPRERAIMEPTVLLNRYSKQSVEHRNIQQIDKYVSALSVFYPCSLQRSSMTIDSAIARTIGTLLVLTTRS